MIGIKTCRNLSLFLAVVFLVSLALPSETSHARRRRYKLPTHPVVLWSRTISRSKDLEQRRVAAFKLSQYSQRLFQSSVIDTLTSCVRDPDIQIRVFCVKALGNTGNKRSDSIRRVLLDRFKTDPEVKSTVVRTFLKRRDDSLVVHDTLLKSLMGTNDTEFSLSLLSYFEELGSGSTGFVNSLV